MFAFLTVCLKHWAQQNLGVTKKLGTLPLNAPMLMGLE